MAGLPRTRSHSFVSVAGAGVSAGIGETVKAPSFVMATRTLKPAIAPARSARAKSVALKRGGFLDMHLPFKFEVTLSLQTRRAAQQERPQKPNVLTSRSPFYAGYRKTR